jgi:hypothetical protein
MRIIRRSNTSIGVGKERDGFTGAGTEPRQAQRSALQAATLPRQRARPEPRSLYAGNGLRKNRISR